MKVETLRNWTARLLMGFVLVTIGFAMGRRTAPLPTSDTDMAAGDKEQATQSDKVIVYAAHMTFRCEQCTKIEWFARELLENEFSAELADDRLEFRTVDYMGNPDFAKKYNISSSTIVVVRIEDGEEQGFQRLDEVWTKTRDKEEFFDYVRAAIVESLGEGDDT